MTELFRLLSYIPAIFKFIRVFGTMLLVVGAGLAGFLYSPFFRTFFLGTAVGAALLFGLEYSSFSFFPKQADPAVCVHPKIDPNGPKCQMWVSTDDVRGYGYFKACDGLQ